MRKERRPRPGVTRLLVHEATNVPYVQKGKDGEHGCCRLRVLCRGGTAGITGAANPRFSLMSWRGGVGFCDINTRCQKLDIWGERGGFDQEKWQ